MDKDVDAPITGFHGMEDVEHAQLDPEPITLKLHAFVMVDGNTMEPITDVLIHVELMNIQ